MQKLDYDRLSNTSLYSFYLPSPTFELKINQFFVSNGANE